MKFEIMIRNYSRENLDWGNKQAVTKTFFKLTKCYLYTWKRLDDPSEISTRYQIDNIYPNKRYR